MLLSLSSCSQTVNISRSPFRVIDQSNCNGILLGINRMKDEITKNMKTEGNTLQSVDAGGLLRDEGFKH